MNLTFTVLFMNDAQMAGTGAVGFCDPETQTIGLVGSQSNDSMQDTFLHEVFHAIVHVMDLKETETEENYVRRLATGLCTVWNNNPAAFKWWRELVSCNHLFSAFSSKPRSFAQSNHSFLTANFSL